MYRNLAIVAVNKGVFICVDNSKQLTRSLMVVLLHNYCRIINQIVLNKGICIDGYRVPWQSLELAEG